MRVLVVSSLFPNRSRPTLGQSIFRRTRALARRCAVRVVAPSIVPVVPRQQDWDGVPVVYPRYLHLPKVGVLADGPLYLAAASRAVRRLRREFDFDVIDAHFVYPDGFAAVWLGRMSQRPVVLSGRGTDVNHRCFWWPTRGMSRLALQRSDRLVAVSGALKERMVAAGAAPEKVTVIPNGVDTGMFRPGERATARRALGLPAAQTVLFSAGNLRPAKGFQHLIEGLARALDSPHLYIAGPPTIYQRELERLAEAAGVRGQVAFLGHLRPEEMPQWYQAADLFCFGSLREGCPNVVLEALACGTPVVSSRVGGVPDMVEDGCTGVLFEPGSGEAFGRALETALARSWDRELIAERGRRRSWEQVAGEYCAVFEQAIDARKTAVGAAT